MARVQRVVHDTGLVTWTVISETDYAPVAQVDDYLRFLVLDHASPNTVRSYATGLASWLTFLDLRGYAWDEFPKAAFGEYMNWLRYGDQPGVLRIAPSEQKIAPSTLKLRAAAVLAFYRYQASAHLVTGPYQTLYTPLAKRGRRPYVPFLEGVAPRQATWSTLFRVRSGPRGRTPVLTPEQVRTILDGCATQDDTGRWAAGDAGVRNRFLFALLAESGLRLGEALSLRHTDIQTTGRSGLGAVHVVPRQDHPHRVRVKSPQGRTVYVSADLISLYNEWAWRLADRGADMVTDLPNAFVFVNVDRGEQFAPLRVESVYATVRSLTRRHPGVLPSGWSPHWLRHTHATALLLEKCPPHVVMRRLGHMDIQTTMSTYAWVTTDAELQALAHWQSFAGAWTAQTETTDQP